MSQQLANRLMLRGGSSDANLPTAIFGTAGQMSQTLDLGKPRARIGMWPIVSVEKPEIAMGLATILSFHLERYQSVRVYRLFAQLSDDPNDYAWDLSLSQFHVDDWQLDNLDENVAIWGRLEAKGATWRLEIDIEDDMASDDDVETRVYEADNLIALVTEMPVIAEDILRSIGDHLLKKLDVIYATEDWNETALAIFVSQVFKWEVDLLLVLSGQPVDVEDRLNAAEALCDCAQAVGQLGAWGASLAIERWLIFANATDTENINSDLVEIAVDKLENSPFPGIILSQRLFMAGDAQAATGLIEDAMDAVGVTANLALVKSDLLRRVLDVPGAIDTAQEAIESGEINVRLLMQYAELLQLADYNNFEVEHYALGGSTALEEAVAAYDQVLSLAPDDVEALSQKLLHCIDLDRVDDDFWSDFARLVVIDTDGSAIKNVLDNLYPDDADMAVEVLVDAIVQVPGRLHLSVHLAAAHLLAESFDDAAEVLEDIRDRLTGSDDVLLAEVDRLLLAVDDPDFEMRIGEFTSLVDAGKSLPSDDVEYLENAIERAPTFAEGYVLLARSYLTWDETSAAIETLLDGHKQLPEDPEIIRILIRALWLADERDLALSYLNKGIAANPDYVPLLAEAGQYLFVAGQQDLARAFLLRAELIAPRDPALIAARAYIARRLGD